MSKTKHQKGFRLQYIEIFNWGTFDEMIWRLDPKGDNSLLTGANGSGKTTLVDAVITLLVPPTSRHYNQSSGSESRRERDEKTYTRGAYTTVQSDSGLSAKTKYLRTRDAFSILLGTFYNADIKEYVTLAQVRWFANNDLKRSYLILPSAVTISEHFQPMDTGGVWKKRLKKQHGAEEFSSFTKYSQRFGKLFGLKSDKALTLFAQTVGIKVLGNLNDFIRQNMLEEYDAESEFQKLYEHYESLLSAHKSIEKAREQARLLEPIAEGGAQYTTLTDEVRDLERVEDAVTPYFAQEKIDLYQRNMRTAESDVQKKNSRIESIKAELTSLDARRNDLQVSISTDKAYEQIQNLEKEILQAEQDKTRKQNRAKRYNELADFLELNTDPNEKTFYKNLAAGQRDIEDLRSEGEAIEESNVQANIQLDRVKTESDDLKAQLLSLQQRRNRIPVAQIDIRAKLLEKLEISENELPFAAELMKVKEDEKEWEAVVERLLRPAGMTLLVKEKYYEAVLTYVHLGKLGGKISFLKIPELNFNAKGKQANEKSILQKIEFKPNNDFVPFLENYLTEDYDLTVVKGYKTMKDTPQAVNERGLWRRDNRHERDDRSESGQSPDYILGWDNRETVVLMQRQLKEAEEQAEKIRMQLKSSRTRRNTLNEKRDKLLSLTSFEQFAEIDWKGAMKQMKAFEKEKDTLLQSSNRLQDLEAQLQQLKSEISDKEKEKERLIEQRGNLQSRLQVFTEGLQDAEKTFAQFKSPKLRGLKDVILALIPESDRNFTPSRIDTIERQTAKTASQQKEKKARELATTERKLSLAMQKFISPGQETLNEYPDWTAETIDFIADVNYLEQYAALHRKITQEDLPKYQKRFKDWLNERMIFDIANFKTALENQESQIKDSIEEINSSLLEIDFNAEPKTFIQLDINKTRDIAVRDFKQMIKDAMPDPAKLIKGDEKELEASFKKIKQIIEELASNENWRKKVTDVRNWLEFAADERYRDDKTQRQYYVDSQSLSGGEKAKLAYTILASAIAYQFGIRNEGRRAKSFRFAVVDEAFSKVDPENSIYAMELFKQLDLQLMVVTPLDKINLAEPYIRSVHFVQNRAKRNSEVYDLPMEVYLERKESFGE